MAYLLTGDVHHAQDLLQTARPTWCRPSNSPTRCCEPPVSAGADEKMAAWCCEHIELGVRAELAEHFGGALPPVRVVLRRVLQHPVDSNVPRNQEAGRRLVLRALETLDSR